MNDVPYLNESQLRRLSTVLASLEEDLVRIESLIDGEGHAGSIFQLINDVRPEARDDIRNRIGTLREYIWKTATRFKLETTSKHSTRQISGILSSCWVSIEECKSSYLRGYGKISDEFADVLDPELDRMTELVWEIQNLVTTHNAD